MTTYIYAKSICHSSVSLRRRAQFICRLISLFSNLVRLDFHLISCAADQVDELVHMQ
jgi:hypothetical protein